MGCTAPRAARTLPHLQHGGIWVQPIDLGDLSSQGGERLRAEAGRAVWGLRSRANRVVVDRAVGEISNLQLKYGLWLLRSKKQSQCRKSSFFPERELMSAKDAAFCCQMLLSC